MDLYMKTNFFAPQRVEPAEILLMKLIINNSNNIIIYNIIMNTCVSTFPHITADML